MRVTAFKPTSEDWYGEFRIADDMRHIDKKLVEVSLLRLSDGNWRVCVWGNDDHGLELDTPYESNARNILSEVLAMDDVTHFQLQELGFVRA